MASSKYALIMQMELVWPAALRWILLTIGMATLTGALIGSDFTFSQSGFNLSSYLCIIHDIFFLAQQIVNI